MQKHTLICLSQSGYQSSHEENDHYLSTLSLIIKDCALTPSRLRDVLITSSQPWARGNMLDVQIEGNTALVGSQFDEDDELDKIKISKERLIKFIDDWLDAIKNKPDEITLYRDDNFNIWIETDSTH